METKLEKRINATEEILDYCKNVGPVSRGIELIILENQLAIMKERSNSRLKKYRNIIPIIATMMQEFVIEQFKSEETKEF